MAHLPPRPLPSLASFFRRPAAAGVTAMECPDSGLTRHPCPSAPQSAFKPPNCPALIKAAQVRTEARAGLARMLGAGGLSGHAIECRQCVAACTQQWQPTIPHCGSLLTLLLAVASARPTRPRPESRLPWPSRTCANITPRKTNLRGFSRARVVSCAGPLSTQEPD